MTKSPPVDSLVYKNRTKSSIKVNVTVTVAVSSYEAVDFENLCEEDEIVNLDEKKLRTELETLPCCATTEDGTANGDPLNLVAKISRQLSFAEDGSRPNKHTEKRYGRR